MQSESPKSFANAWQLAPCRLKRPTQHSEQCPRTSKEELRTKLNLPRRADDTCNRARLRCADRRIGEIELRRVERIEDFSAELDAVIRLDAELLEQREVEIHTAGAVQDVSAGVAVGEWRRGRERRGVEPPVHGRVIQLAIADAVGALPGSRIDRRRAERRGERQTCLERVYPVDLPTAGQCIVPGDRETVADVER